MLLLTEAIDVVVGIAHSTQKLYQLLLNTPIQYSLPQNITFSNYLQQYFY